MYGGLYCTITYRAPLGFSNAPSPSIPTLNRHQARFRGAQGFASTVWDSSIVVSKLLERQPSLVVGRRVLDLSAGCGLVALAAAKLGAARTVATDLGPNLPLLRRNCERNGAWRRGVE
jgi:predicted nicotinamide N-methyase